VQKASSPQYVTIGIEMFAAHHKKIQALQKLYLLSAFSLFLNNIFQIANEKRFFLRETSQKTLQAHYDMGFCSQRHFGPFFF